jgi:ATP phosphoribosyltransferase
MLTLHCPPKQVQALAIFLREHGAEAVSVAALDYVYARDNPLHARLVAELERDGPGAAR